MSDNSTTSIPSSNPSTIPSSSSPSPSLVLPSSSSSNINSNNANNNISGSNALNLDSSFKRRLARRHVLQQKYAQQDNSHPSFFDHAKHIFLFTWSGRPIWSRYGDESKLAGYIGVLCTLIANIEHAGGGDKVRHIIAGRSKVVFMLFGPIYLVCISKTSESIAQLASQLALCHSQLLSVLTVSIVPMLIQRPQTDIRNLITGTESLLSSLVTANDTLYGALTDAISPARIPINIRNKVGLALKKCAGKDVVYGLLLHEHDVIHVVRGKDRPLHAQDVLILTNFLNNAQNLREGESFTPICLPKFADKGYLYAYVKYLSSDICLTLISGDAQSCPNLRNAANAILLAFGRKPSNLQTIYSTNPKLDNTSPNNSLTLSNTPNNNNNNMASSEVENELMKVFTSVSQRVRLAEIDAPPTPFITNPIPSNTLSLPINIHATTSQNPQNNPPAPSPSPPSVSNTNSNSNDNSIWSTSYSICSDIIHFVYKSETHNQVISSHPECPFNDKTGRKLLFRQHQHIRHRLIGGGGSNKGAAAVMDHFSNNYNAASTGASSYNNNNSNKQNSNLSTNRKVSVYFESSNLFTSYGQVKNGEYELVILFTPFISKQAAVNGVTRVLRWIKKNESSLFI